MSYYPELASHTRDIVTVELDFIRLYRLYSTEKELKHATGVDTCNLTAKNNFIALKAEVNKLDINKLVNVPTGVIK